MFPLSGLDGLPCPFMGGVNQLWRNQLLALSIEKSPDWPYKRVYFSVVYHPGNQHLKSSMESFKQILGDTDRFFWFPSSRIIDAARDEEDADMRDWVAWYEQLYALGCLEPNCDFDRE